MKLKEYIKWANNLDEYQDSATLADLNAWGFEVMPGSYRIPKLNLNNATKGTEGYDSIRNDLISNWAKVTFPFLESSQVKTVDDVKSIVKIITNYNKDVNYYSLL